MGMLTNLMIIAVTSLIIKNCYGLDCYDCEYWGQAGDEGCQQSPPPSKYLKQCDIDRCVLIYAKDAGTTYAQRRCGVTANAKTGCKKGQVNPISPTGPFYDGVTCVCNDADGCNSVGRGVPSRILLLLAVVVGVVVYFQW